MSSQPIRPCRYPWMHAFVCRTIQMASHFHCLCLADWLIFSRSSTAGSTLAALVRLHSFTAVQQQLHPHPTPTCVLLTCEHAFAQASWRSAFVGDLSQNPNRPGANGRQYHGRKMAMDANVRIWQIKQLALLLPTSDYQGVAISKPVIGPALHV